MKNTSFPCLYHISFTSFISVVLGASVYHVLYPFVHVAGVFSPDPNKSQQSDNLLIK